METQFCLPPFLLIRDFEKQSTAETFPKFQSVLRVIDRSDQTPPITATGVTFHLLYVMLTGCDWWIRSDLSITRKTDGNFGNVSVSVLFSKVAYQ